MKRTRLVSSFVVTAAAMACNHAEPTRTTATSTTAAASTTASASATAAPSASTRKRKRTASATRGATQAPLDQVALANVVAQNPTDAKGNVVYAAPDDRCYVEVPMKPPIPPLPPGGRAFDSTYVDCPSEMDDPAWDSCAWGTLYADKKTRDCACSPLAGNPPPPPYLVTCPAKIKR